MSNLLSPLSDDVFKYIFADQKNIDNLAGLLRPIVNLPDAEYSRLTIVDPFLKRFFKHDKKGVLDVKLLTGTGKVVNVEVQVLRFAALRKRILYYHSKMLWEQLRGGDAYDRIQQVICVVICNHLLPEEPGGGPPDRRYLKTFSLREDLSGETFTDLIKVVTIELPKVPAEADGHPAWPWVRFFVCREEEEFTMLAEGHPEMTKVVGVLKKLSWGEKRRVLAEKDEMWRRDLQAWASDIAREAAAEAEARAEARDRERAYQEKLETARRLKLMGLSVEQIAAATKLSAGELESL